MSRAQAVERGEIERVTAAQKKGTKKKKKARLGLLNWPPSRGPQPAWMKAKTKYEIPPVEIEMIELVRDGDSDARPATPIKRIPTKEKVGRRTVINHLVQGRGRCKTEKYKYIPKSEWALSLFAHVDTCASLKPEQWQLVGGAELVPARVGKTLGGGAKRRPAYASLETFLTDETVLTFDLTYPLSKVARVTVRPYKIIGRFRGTKFSRMSVGYVLWQLARAYRKIYRQHARYGIWGHAIGDLCFERMRIKDNVGEVEIGS